MPKEFSVSFKTQQFNDHLCQLFPPKTCTFQLADTSPFNLGKRLVGDFTGFFCSVTPVVLCGDAGSAGWVCSASLSRLRFPPPAPGPRGHPVPLWLLLAPGSLGHCICLAVCLPTEASVSRPLSLPRAFWLSPTPALLDRPSWPRSVCPGPYVPPRPSPDAEPRAADVVLFLCASG